jgi:hypothetical protein
MQSDNGLRTKFSTCSTAYNDAKLLSELYVVPVQGAKTYLVSAFLNGRTTGYHCCSAATRSCL